MAQELTEYRGPTYGSPYYDIDEVDAVLAEKDEEIAGLKEIDSKNRSAYYKDLAMMAKDVERQKYKRCLNNAWWLLREEFFAEDCHCEHWVDWAIKWHKRWLDIAEKFKEAK